MYVSHTATCRLLTEMKLFSSPCHRYIRLSFGPPMEDLDKGWDLWDTVVTLPTNVYQVWTRWNESYARVARRTTLLALAMPRRTDIELTSKHHARNAKYDFSHHVTVSYRVLFCMYQPAEKLKAQGTVNCTATNAGGACDLWQNMTQKHASAAPASSRLC